MLGYANVRLDQWSVPEHGCSVRKNKDMIRVNKDDRFARDILNPLPTICISARDEMR